jgi:hypothetical protein
MVNVQTLNLCICPRLYRPILGLRFYHYYGFYRSQRQEQTKCQDKYFENARTVKITLNIPMFSLFLWQY